MPHQPYPSIEQFRHTIRSVHEQTRFAGKDADGNVIYDSTRALPKLTFTGTVKVHGTNAGIIFLRKDGQFTGQVEAQSRSRTLIAPGDNEGFRAWVETLSRDTLTALYNQGIRYFDASTTDRPLTIFGEWSGKGIQKGVAVNEVDKFFYIFGIKLGDGWENITNFNFTSAEYRIYSADTIWLKSIEVDFNDPVSIAQAQETLRTTTERVEASCPVGKFFGVDGIGEGVVWECRELGNVLRFKVKGEKHTSSKVKTLAAVDVEKVASLAAFTDKVLTESRLTQGLQVLKERDLPISEKSTGDFLRWIVSDVLKEESDTMLASGLTEKDVSKAIGTMGRQWFFRNLP